MVFLQALLSYVSRSAGKILQALFGWAVQAIFGETKKGERTFLSAVIAAAAFWPLLLLGIAFPKIAAAVLAFVPVARKIPSSWVRWVWIALALADPLLVGFVMARRAKKSGSAPATILSGFPTTVALAGAFTVIAVGAPLRRIAAMFRGRRDEHVPFIVDLDEYHPVARVVAEALGRAGLSVEPARPPWTTRLPSAILRKLAPRSFADHVPERLEFFHGPDLDVAVHPNGVTVQGGEDVVARAHGFIAEAITASKALQTNDPRAQEIEKSVKDVWKVVRGNLAHRDSEILQGRVREIAASLADLPVSYDDWETLYREILQLSRAVHARGQLFDRDEARKEETMAENPAGRALGDVSTTDLIARITGDVRNLVRQEVELARVEWKNDWKAELGSVRNLGAGALLVLLGLALLLVAGALALAAALEWSPAAGVLAGGGVLLVAGIGLGAVGWARRVKSPLDATRRTLREDWRWARNRIA
jgi:hypothetical protein